MARIPVNGVEMAQWAGAKQALDMGSLRHRVPAHFDRGGGRPTRSAPAAIRGLHEERRRSTSRPASAATARTAAARYWGLSQQDYYKKADV